MRTSLVNFLRCAVPVALVAFALTLSSHAPARADSGPQQQMCGTVDLNAASSADAARAFDCFSGAFAGCKPATLLANTSEAGVATAYSFTTVDGGDDHGCSVSEVVEKQTGGTKTTDSYLCRTVSRDKDGALHFGGCGAQKDVSLRVTSAVSTAAPISATGAAPKN